MRLSLFDRLACGAYALLALEALARFSPGLSICPFRALTGHPCPGCGMGHALVLGLQGRWAESFAAHPFGPPLLAVWTAYLAWGGANLARGRNFSRGWPALAPRAAWGLLAAVLAAWLTRAL